MSETSRFPDSLVLIFGMILLAQIATLVLPAGAFERDGRRVVPGTYQRLEHAQTAANAEAEPADAEPAGLSRRVLGLVPAALLAIPKGMEKSADIIFFVFLIGGVISILRKTGAIDALLNVAIERLGSRPALLIAGVTSLLAVGASVIGMAEEYMPFVPILVTMSLALKLDAVVAMGIVYIGAGVGYGCAALNPFTVLIGQDIAGLPPASGQSFRWLLLVVCLAVGVHHIMRYVARIKADPSRSLVADIDYSDGFERPEGTRFTAGRLLVLIAFVAVIGVFVWGAKYREWYLTELSALFLALGLAAALLCRMSANETARAFCHGAAEMTTTALLIGFARTIQVVLTDGQVIDTVIHAIAQPLEQVGSSGAAVGMLAVQAVCNFSFRQVRARPTSRCRSWRRSRT